MKRLFTFLVVTGLAMPIIASATLWSYYSERGQNLPSINERAKIASNYGIYDYHGSKAQNDALEAYLRGNTPQFGGNVPASGVTWYLASPITSSETTLTFSSVKDIRGNYIDATYLPTKIYFTIEPSNLTNTEIIVCPSSGYASTTKTFSSCTRGLAFYGTSETSVTANKKSHSSGSSVVMSNPGQFYNNFLDLDGFQILTGQKRFDVYPYASSTVGNPTTTWQFATKGYVDTVGAGGFTSGNIGDGKTLRANGTAPETMDINTSTSSWAKAFDINAGGFFDIATTTGSAMDKFWDDKLIATSTLDNFKIASTTLSGNTLVTGNATATGAFNIENLDINGNFCFDNGHCITRNTYFLVTSTSATSTIVGVHTFTGFATTTVTGGSMGKNGSISSYARGTYTSTDAGDAVGASYGGKQICNNALGAATAGWELIVDVVNIENENKQKMFCRWTVNATTAIDSKPIYAEFDSTTDKNIIIHFGGTNAADRVDLEYWRVDGRYYP